MLYRYPKKQYDNVKAGVQPRFCKSEATPSQQRLELAKVTFYLRDLLPFTPISLWLFLNINLKRAVLISYIDFGKNSILTKQ